MCAPGPADSAYQSHIARDLFLEPAKYRSHGTNPAAWLANCIRIGDKVVYFVETTVIDII